MTIKKTVTRKSTKIMTIPAVFLAVFIFSLFIPVSFNIERPNSSSSFLLNKAEAKKKSKKKKIDMKVSNINWNNINSESVMITATIKNTGKKPVMINTLMGYLYSSEGNLIGAGNGSLDVVPEILQPGQTARGAAEVENKYIDKGVAVASVNLIPEYSQYKKKAPKLEILNTKLITTDDSYTFSGSIKNLSKKASKSSEACILYYDSSNKLIDVICVPPIIQHSSIAYKNSLDFEYTSDKAFSLFPLMIRYEIIGKGYF